MIKIDKSTWVRILTSSIIIASTILFLKLIFGMIPESVVLISIIIPTLLNSATTIKDSIIIGALIGVASGVLLSIFYLGPMIFATVIFIFFSIVGMLISYFIRNKM